MRKKLKGLTAKETSSSTSSRYLEKDGKKVLKKMIRTKRKDEKKLKAKRLNC
jgi:hypothetical protein